jgi:hypothetical protein
LSSYSSDPSLDDRVRPSIAVDVAAARERSADPIAGRGTIDPITTGAERRHVDSARGRLPEDHINGAGDEPAVLEAGRRAGECIGPSVAVDVAGVRDGVAEAFTTSALNPVAVMSEGSKIDGRRRSGREDDVSASRAAAVRDGSADEHVRSSVAVYVAGIHDRPTRSFVASRATDLDVSS